MNKKMRTQDIVMAALLTALSVLITFSPFKLPVPAPFSVTLGSHVPTMIALFINPVVAVLTVIGSSVGFLMATGNVIIVARAASHLFFALAGVYMIKKNINIFITIIVTSILHAGAEAILVQFMTPLIAPEKMTATVTWFAFIGTLFHHYVDCAITAPILAALQKARLVNSGIHFKKKEKEVAL